jgi:hypothetical protein
MKKKGKDNKLILIVAIVIFVLAGLAFVLRFSLTGWAVMGPPENAGEQHTIGPSQQEQQCMMACMKCTSIGVGCTGDSAACQAQCNAKKPEQTAEEKCVEECAKKGCGEFDFNCQSKNQAICDKECGMIKEPEAKSAEEQCIRDCVNKESPGLRCQGGEGGEKGNEICQRCAKSCEYLYNGPCLDEVKLEAAKSACNTCEHCYGAPIMGDSGEGYECIVNVECKDSSAEFGDESGTGKGIASNMGEAVSGVVEAIGNFFGNLFGGD